MAVCPILCYYVDQSMTCNDVDLADLRFPIVVPATEKIMTSNCEPKSGLQAYNVKEQLVKPGVILIQTKTCFFTLACRNTSFSVPVANFDFPNAAVKIMGVNSAENISLANSNFSRIPANFFEKMNHLQNLDLHNNQLHNLHLIFPTPAKLQNLDLSDNKLDSMPLIFQNKSTLNSEEGYGPYKDYSYLNVSRNELETLDPETFCGYHYLKMIDLSHNRLAKFDSSCDLNVKRLYLAGNFLQVLPRASFPYLKVLDLSCNHINQSSLKWENMTLLQHLRLDSNPLQELPQGSFQNLTDLRILNLSNCSLVYIHDESFKGLRMLAMLHLANNKLAQLGNSLVALTSLTTLDLCSNLVSDLRHI